MECLAKVELSQNKIKEVIRKTGACVVHGGSMNLAPADDKIIEVEHPLSIDAEGQLLASVMAKKYSVSANYVLIDIPMGPQVKAKNRQQAKRLKKMFEKIGEKLDMKVKVIITDGTQPIGFGIGPLLESLDVMAVLKDDVLAPEDLKKKALYMAGTLLKMTGKYSLRQGIAKASEILESGKALVKMNQIIKSQGRVRRVKVGEFKRIIKSNKAGKIKGIDNKIIAKIARIAGAPGDKGAGMYINRKVGDKVKKGDILYTVYAENKFKLELAVSFLRKDKGYLIR